VHKSINKENCHRLSLPLTHTHTRLHSFHFKSITTERRRKSEREDEKIQRGKAVHVSLIINVRLVAHDAHTIETFKGEKIIFI
jgi:hypothetical protein